MNPCTRLMPACLAIAGLASLQMMLGGCVSSVNSSISRRPADSHAIFDPEWAVSSAPVTDRPSWPATEGREFASEWVEYQESVKDFQGLNGRSEDHYRRRVYSVRGGGSSR